MKYSNVALYIYAMREMQIFTTNQSFHSKFKNINDLRRYVAENKQLLVYVDILKKRLDTDTSIDGFISLFDDEFPQLSNLVTKADIPVLLFYKGDISLIKNTSKNVAVIGSRVINNEIAQRERKLVKYLVSNDKVIVSGLAVGCDTVAHQEAILQNKKTIAILSTKLDSIYPAQNKKLASQCTLLISEYNDVNNNEFKKRLVYRDRLQAMLSSSIIACAGGEKSGTRHAMKKAEIYCIPRFVMYNSQLDVNNSHFGLAEKLLNSQSANTATKANLDTILSNINYCEKDIFEMNVDAIVNPINCVGTMGKGLALAFKETYPNNFTHYKHECSKGNVVIGKMLTYQESDKLIINFPTKLHWRDKSIINYIESGLDDLISIIETNSIKSIAIPALGAGLGSLEWSVVKDTIEKKLSNVAKYVDIYVIPPR